jgi:lysine 2,3-aminomutase
VILTGGDPLILSARRLRAVMKALGEIDHVKVVRIHTRVPIADPVRITPDLVRAMKINGKGKGKPTYVTVHVNHARELPPAARKACAAMADAGIPLLAQSVLVAGVNDSAAALADLMRALVECRIKPYYLHHGDLAPGTSHLRTDIATGQGLMKELRGRLSGLCQPTYVLDIPGGHGKSPIGPNYIERTTKDGQVTVEDFNGGRHAYPPHPR